MQNKLLLLLQIHEPPQSITVTVIEKAPGLDARKLAKVGLPLPDEDRITRMNAPLEVVQFGSDLFVDRFFKPQIFLYSELFNAHFTLLLEIRFCDHYRFAFYGVSCRIMHVLSAYLRIWRCQLDLKQESLNVISCTFARQHWKSEEKV